MSTLKSKNKIPLTTENKDSGLMSFLNAGYNGSAIYGKIIAIQNFIGFLILYIIVIFSVNHFFYKKEDIYGENIIKGKINESICRKNTTFTTSSDRNTMTTNYDCSMNISYNIDNINYDKKNHKTYSTTYYPPNSIVNLRYNKYDKNDITTDTWSSNFIGNIIIIFFSIILIISLISTINVFLFQPAAAATGAASLGNTISHGISSGWNQGKYS